MYLAALFPPISLHLYGLRGSLLGEVSKLVPIWQYIYVSFFWLKNLEVIKQSTAL